MKPMEGHTLTRNEFQLLREAKQLIKKEFGENLTLTADDLLERIYHFALESEEEILFEIFEQLNNSSITESKGNNPADKEQSSGKRFYRGAEIIEPSA